MTDRDHHDHGHGGGHHDHTHGASERSVGIAALLTGAFMGVELVGGLISGSLALLADAGHMLTDFASLVLAWFGFRLARRPATWRKTYGYDRFSVLVAFVNGLTLFAIAGWIVVEAWHRLGEPGEILGGVMLAIAVAGLAVNVVCFYILQSGDSDNLNVRAAALHVAGDMLGSVAAIAAALVILWTGWTPIDPILSVLVALIILRSAWFVVRESAHILLEGTPQGLEVEEVSSDLIAEVEGVAHVHHIHAWSITQERPMMTLNAVLEAGTDHDEAVAAIKARLAERFGIDHATVEIDRRSAAA